MIRDLIIRFKYRKIRNIDFEIKKIFINSIYSHMTIFSLSAFNGEFKTYNELLRLKELRK